jgi:hypothetical protein
MGVSEVVLKSYLPDRLWSPADSMWAKVACPASRSAEAVRVTCADVGLPLVDVPPGQDTAGGMVWIARGADLLPDDTAG